MSGHEPLTPRPRLVLLAFATALILLVRWPLDAAGPATRPEDVGLSPERLQRIGEPRGEAYGLSVRVVNDPIARNSFLSEGSFGWSGAFGTHFWVDRKERLIPVAMTRTSNQEFLRDFESMVMQAVVASAPGHTGAAR